MDMAIHSLRISREVAKIGKRADMINTSTPNLFSLIVVLTSAFAGVLRPVPTSGQTAGQIAQESFPSVVLLVMEDANGQPISLGSGFFVRENVVASNRHVVEGASRGYAKLVGQKAKYNIAGVAGIDASHDLVLLTVLDAKAPSLTLSDSKQAAIGDNLYVVGNPQGLEGTFSQGIVSGIREIGTDTLLQITAPISPGSSGGPVLNSKGKVVGVAVATFKGGQNLNFAIPANYLAALLVQSKTSRTTPLSKETTAKQDKSILNDLGGHSTEGVIGAQFAWSGGGSYTFSLRNQLDEAVKNVYCLVVFYDKESQPLDFSVVQYSGVIPPGLAKRVSGDVDVSVPVSIGAYVGGQKTKIELRVLDFQLAE